MARADLADAYSGFDDYDHAYDTQHLPNDPSFQEALSRSSHGRRPMSKMGPGRLATASMGVARGETALARPMTAVRAAGYSSFARRTIAHEANIAARAPKDESIDNKMNEMEEVVLGLVRESAILAEKKELKAALEKAKEAGRRDRMIVKTREENGLSDQLNLDLSFTVMSNLAQQYLANDMTSEALSTYELMMRSKSFPSAARLKLNMGNIFFRRKDYEMAMKHYQMALDQVHSVQKRTRLAIHANIAMALVRLGRYDDAFAQYEHCVEDRPSPLAAHNLVLTAYCLEDSEKMRDSFLRLLEIPSYSEDDLKANDDGSGLLRQLMKDDQLGVGLRRRKVAIERNILTAAKVIAPAIAEDSAQGHEWCIEMMKQSEFAYLASELEMAKAVQLMREGKLEQASQALASFSNKDNKTAAAAASNLAVLEWASGEKGRSAALSLVKQALSLDRYQTAAHVMAGILHWEEGKTDVAIAHLQEALDNDALCAQALYNLALIYRKTNRIENALECFYKLNNILRNNVQVLCQLALIYEFMEDSGQAIDLYSQANSLAPSDPSILTRLATIYNNEGDKTQAFQCLYDSYRYLPSNLAVIEWMGAYYVEAQFAEKAVSYFEKAAIMQPNEMKWQMMIASCHRRSGNYQKAFQLYKNIHNKFPSNTEVLKFLVRIATDLGVAEAKEYAMRLERAEKVKQLRQQRESDSAQSKRHSANSAHSLPLPISERTSSGEHRLLSAHASSESEPYRPPPRDMKSADLSYVDPIGNAPVRPKTGHRGGLIQNRDDSFEDLDESFLPN